MTVNGPGVDIWLLLADDISTDELVAELTQRFDADELTVRRDATALVDQLIEHGFVTGR
jgi:hypothetical protein